MRQLHTTHIQSDAWFKFVKQKLMF